MKSNVAVSARPRAGEYAPYYEKYVSLIPEGDILTTLERQPSAIAAILSTRNEVDGAFRYAPGKWSVKEVLGHVIDSERVFSYRALRIARNDKTPIEGFEQDDYVKYGPFSQCSLAALVEEFKSVRLATVSLFRGLDEAAWCAEAWPTRTKSACGSSLISLPVMSCITRGSCKRSTSPRR